jgi:sigma-B regulation protein RsbU (phosphoserine phosphatase)
MNLNLTMLRGAGVTNEMSHDRAADREADLARLHQRLQQAYEQRENDFSLCRRIQQSLLPSRFPEMPPARFAVHYHPCGRAGGDCYDVFRLDEDHVGFWLADVMGHGVPAGLLSIFLKKAVRFKEIAGQTYRLLRPHEVLEQLNRELLDLAVTDHPFISMVYALFDRRDGSLSFARAGHPHPILLSRRGDARACQLHGTMLGLFETEFATETLRLRAGDKMLLHTAGPDWSSADSKPSGNERLLALAARHGASPVQQWVDQLAHDLLGHARQLDDLTLLGLEVRA